MRGDKVPKITTSEKNGIGAALDENTAAMNEIHDVVRLLLEEQKRQHGLLGKHGTEVLMSLIVAMLIALGSWIWTNDRNDAVQDNDISTLKARAEVWSEINSVKDRLKALEDWRTRDNGP